MEGKGKMKEGWNKREAGKGNSYQVAVSKMNLKYKKRMFEFGEHDLRRRKDFVLKDVEVDFVPKKEDMKNIDFGGLQKSLSSNHTIGLSKWKDETFDSFLTSFWYWKDTKWRQIFKLIQSKGTEFDARIKLTGGKNLMQG